MGILFVVSPYSHRTLTNILAVYQGKIGDKSMARVEDLSVTYRRLIVNLLVSHRCKCIEMKRNNY